MIYSLTGTILEKSPNEVVIQCAGVGYLVGVPMQASGRLPEVGSEATLYTAMNISENDVSLVGFTSREEREMFGMLTSVSGVGAKVALAILSALPPRDIVLAVSAGDYKAFTQASGVGPKLGQRLILELKDKVAKGMSFEGVPVGSISAAASSELSGAPQQAVAALVSLGYTQSEAAAAVAKIDPGMPAAEIIRLALRGMGGNK